MISTDSKSSQNCSAWAIDSNPQRDSQNQVLWHIPRDLKWSSSCDLLRNVGWRWFFFEASEHSSQTYLTNENIDLMGYYSWHNLVEYVYIYIYTYILCVCVHIFTYIYIYIYMYLLMTNYNQKLDYLAVTWGGVIWFILCMIILVCSPHILQMLSPIASHSCPQRSYVQDHNW